jgi:hypothetical protein
LPLSIRITKSVSSGLLAKPLTKSRHRIMIKVTTVEGETLVVNEDYIITIGDLADEDKEANAAILIETPNNVENTIGVMDTMDELYYEINRV